MSHRDIADAVAMNPTAYKKRIAFPTNLSMSATLDFVVHKNCIVQADLKFNASSSSPSFDKQLIWFLACQEETILLVALPLVRYKPATEEKSLTFLNKKGNAFCCDITTSSKWEVHDYEANGSTVKIKDMINFSILKDHLAIGYNGELCVLPKVNSKLYYRNNPEGLVSQATIAVSEFREQYADEYNEEQ